MSDDLPSQLRQLVPACDDPCDYTEDDRKILAAADRIKELERERDALFRRATLAEEWRDHDRERALSARREALEEAARVVEDTGIKNPTLMVGLGGICCNIAAAIRALMEKE